MHPTDANRPKTAARLAEVLAQYRQPRVATRLRRSWAFRVFGTVAVLSCALSLAGCKSGKLIWAAERKAQMGGEFIRLYDDGRAEYGYGVVTEKLKAEGPYHRKGDTLFFDDPSFLPHFSKGYVIEKRGTVLMESGFHFLVVDMQKP